MKPTGETRVCVIVGHPIAQVRSPEMFNTRFETLGIDAVMVPADIGPAQLTSFMELLRGWHNCNGCVVTIPHKRTVVPFVDRLTDRARRLGAVTVLRRRTDGTFCGDMLDGVGFMAAAAGHGFAAEGRAAVIFGAGGAGSAIADALCDARIAELAVSDVDEGRAAALRSSLAAEHPTVRIRPLTGVDLARFDLVVNASPIGMDSHVAMPIDAGAVETLRPSALVADVVTRPAVTAFLAAAGRRGCSLQTGAEMAERQVESLGRFMQLMP